MVTEDITDPLLKSPSNVYDSISYEDGEKEDHKKEISTSNGEQILALAVPALGALLIDPLMNLIDTALVGQYSGSADELAGMGASSALLAFAFYAFNFLCIATTPLVGARRAAGDEEGTKQIGGQALSFSLCMGIVLACLLLLFHEPLLNIYGVQAAGNGTQKYATDFLMTRALAAPAVLSISASTGILRGYLDTTTPIYILIIANVINLTLDFALIPLYGPTGAAIATTTAEWVSACIFMGILAGKLPSANTLWTGEDNPVSITPSLSVPSWNDMKPLVVASSSVLQRSLFLQLSLSFAASMAARAGAPSVAAHQIGIQLWVLCCMIADSLEAAAQALVSDAIGRQASDDVRKISSTIFCYAFVLGVILMLGLGVGDITGFLLKFFTSDSDTQVQLSHIVTIVVLVQPMNCLVFAADGVLQGAAEFQFQAQAMGVSAAGALLFYMLVPVGDPLVRIWESLVILQALRGLTSLYKLVEKDGPIKLMGPEVTQGILP